MNVNADGFLLPDEENLVHYMLKAHEKGFAWDESEKGQFSSEYFDDVGHTDNRAHSVGTSEHPHSAWNLRPASLKSSRRRSSQASIKIRRSSYRSRWFLRAQERWQITPHRARSPAPQRCHHQGRGGCRRKLRSTPSRLEDAAVTECSTFSLDSTSASSLTSRATSLRSRRPSGRSASLPFPWATQIQCRYNMAISLTCCATKSPSSLSPSSTTCP